MDELVKQLTEMNQHLAGIERRLSRLEAINANIAGIQHDLDAVTVDVCGEGPCLRICGDISAEVAQY